MPIAGGSTTYKMSCQHAHARVYAIPIPVPVPMYLMCIWTNKTAILAPLPIHYDIPLRPLLPLVLSLIRTYHGPCHFKYTCVTSSTLYGTSEHFAVRSLPSFFPFFLFFYCLRSLWPSLSLSRDIQKGYRPGVPFHPPITKLSKKLDFSCSNSSPQFNLKLELELLPWSASFHVPCYSAHLSAWPHIAYSLFLFILFIYFHFGISHPSIGERHMHLLHYHCFSSKLFSSSFSFDALAQRPAVSKPTTWYA